MLNKNKKTEMRDKVLLILGGIICPVSTILMSKLMNIEVQNFTYLASNPPTWIIFTIVATLSAVVECYLIYLIGYKVNMNRQWKKTCIINFVLLMIASQIPYHQEIIWLNTLHVVFGYLAFIYYNYVLLKLYFQLKLYDNRYITLTAAVYLIMLGAIISIIASYGSVNGLAEIIYNVTICLLLTFQFYYNEAN